jgi:hypothetical protein
MTLSAADRVCLAHLLKAAHREHASAKREAERHEGHTALDLQSEADRWQADIDLLQRLLKEPRA